MIDQDLKKHFGVSQPRITVLGLNPHAGESGHLGNEEINTIKPTCEALCQQGLSIAGPVPADSAFIPSMRATPTYTFYVPTGVTGAQSRGVR